ncbi:hypothetical protein BUALT_Bualt02G0065600 [Buddleja alternifolia]|uniref:M-phase phosphoprotein 6 n=1 Tax=Buddleja alternifolia TaxID=168488 RepID=A0AAV6XZD3_9LAMI|nr:hypothetical protein BUALT_Bualt02G0065600 [Buddleja alternifolia]
MAKRELSSTLKNLKFMQRANQKEEEAAKKEEEEVIPAGDFPSSSAVKRCAATVWVSMDGGHGSGTGLRFSIVIAEGDPHPGATRGRMSFLSFNPSIDKLNGEGSDPNETETATTSSGRQSETIPVRENGSDDLELDGSNNDANGDLKRKQAEVASEANYPNKSWKVFSENQHSSPTSNRSSQKKHKREKLDWSVLRPPKHQSKRK